MGRKKGVKKTGGRGKGTPNKVTADLRTWVSELLDNSREQLETDLGTLEPKDRLVILEKLMQYVIPKQQSVSVEAQIQAEYAALEKLLNNAPEAAINAITDRILNLKNISNEPRKEN
jgi:predicted ATP-grasp superfamily ATP-dependent carboligase